MSICDLALDLLPSSAWQGSCLEQGYASYVADMAAVLVIVVVVVTVLFQLAMQTWPERKVRVHRAISALSIILAAIALAVAAGRPVFKFTSEKQADHIVIVVDHSQSAHRLAAARKEVIARLTGYVSGLKEQKEASFDISIVEFAASARVRLNRGTPSRAVDILIEDALAGGLDQSASNVSAGLLEAQRLAEQQGDGDAIILVSDGNSTGQTLEALGQTLSGRSVGIYTVPLSAGPAAEGIVASYLPSVVHAGSKPNFRLVFDPGVQSDKVQWETQLSKNGETLTLDGASLSQTSAIQALRVPVPFEGRGVQFLTFDVAMAEASYTHRAFTLVESPIRVLGVGDAGFLASLPKDRFEVTRTSTAKLPELDEFDIVVLGSIGADTLGASALERLAKYVSTQGLGLLLVNGPHSGGVEDPTVIQSYKETALDLLLPVSPDPKFLLEDPPPRDTIVLVDTSGSMAGAGLNAARSAIGDLLGFLRPQDSIEVITFGGLSSGRQRGNASGKGSIQAFVSRFPTGDSSDVAKAFEQALKVAGNYTSVFLITDGEVVPYDYGQAGLSFYYLQFGSAGSRLNNEISSAARQTQLLQSGFGLSFKPDFFDPEEKTEFFDKTMVSPRIVTPFDGIKGGISTNGVAFSYARVDALRALVRDGGEGEPVLAFRQSAGAGGGKVAAFLSGLDGAWIENQAGREAIEAMLTQLVKWSHRTRYDFRFDDRGDEVGLRISILGSERSLPQTMTASLVIGEGSLGISMQAVKGQKGVFEGSLRLSEANGTGSEKGLLVLEEGGSGAIDQAQAIPVFLPVAMVRKANAREATSFGSNRAGLEALASATGGLFDDLPSPVGRNAQLQVPPRPVHAPLIILAVLLFAIAMGLKGTRL